VYALDLATQCGHLIPAAASSSGTLCSAVMGVCVCVCVCEPVCLSVCTGAFVFMVCVCVCGVFV